MMNEVKMPVRIFRGSAEIGTGELLPNGASLALCPSSEKFELLKFKTDTNKVEERIPMTFMFDEQKVSEGELYHSGDYICLCPQNQDLSLINEDRFARLFVDERGLNARLEVSSKSH